MRHFSAIAEATDLPIIVYNVPTRTGTDMDVETILRIAEIPRVVGLKEASPNFGKIARLMTALPEDFVVFSGEDSTALALIALGGRGLISVASNEIPAEMSALVARRRSTNRWDEARKLQRKYLPLMEMNFWESSPGPAKAALCRHGALRRHAPAPARHGARTTHGAGSRSFSAG